MPLLIKFLATEHYGERLTGDPVLDAPALERAAKRFKCKNTYVSPQRLRDAGKYAAELKCMTLCH